MPAIDVCTETGHNHAHHHRRRRRRCESTTEPWPATTATMGGVPLRKRSTTGRPGTRGDSPLFAAPRQAAMRGPPSLPAALLVPAATP